MDLNWGEAQLDHRNKDTNTTERYEWAEIVNVPNKPGVYAWYYRLELTKLDLEKTIDEIQSNRENGDKEQVKKMVQTFLDKRIFQYFQEDPYKVLVRGPLKPYYEGELRHNPSPSDALIDRIIEDPDRLRTIKEVLEASSPELASPLYIGMSKNLGRRLEQHRRLIDKYRENRLETYSGESQDQNFAFQICQRNILPTRLFVAVRIINGPDNRYVDIENILNRIHYPLFGRN